MKVEDILLFTCECNSNEIPTGMCLKTASEGHLQVVEQALRSVSRPKGSSKELSMSHKLDVRRCEDFDIVGTYSV